MSKKISKAMLKSLEVEFTTSFYSIEDLEAKYSIELSPTDYKYWKKAPEFNSDLVIADTVNVPATTTQLDTMTDDLCKIELKILKAELVKKVKDKIKDLDSYSEVKDIKDLASVIDTLEKSYDKPEKSTSQVNITVQIANLIAKYEQDC
ncbi:MAG: hypothetical protein AB7D38_11990 [Sulfurimonas sp.]|uniref:hypothetical protein n=1 Tax=Sulfurimonas sp. TaxID=2022749 RepID=UPI003D0FC7B0